jgi:hypothetical protein
MRNLLESTAAFVNCVNGVNGRQEGFIAVLKPLVIDLETRQGDKGQAEAA